LLNFGGIPHAKPSQTGNVGDVSLTLLYVSNWKGRKGKEERKKKTGMFLKLKAS